MAHRFFLEEPLPEQPGRPLPLTQADTHHAVRVLRLHAGEEVEVVEPDGRIAHAEVVSADDAGLVVTVLSVRGAQGSSVPSVTLFQGVAKGDKMDDIVRQAVEVGADGIVPVMTSRTIVRLDVAKRVSRGDRWRRIAKSAAEQSKRSGVPAVSDPMPFAEAVALLEDYDRVVVLWEESLGAGLSAALADLRGHAEARVALVVGPEGGLAAEEVERLAAKGAVVASLGAAIMRTETAAVVSLALAIAALGGMGGSE